jgi:hypothetical protein
MAETEVAQLTHSFSAVKPFSNWAGTVLVAGGANADLVSGSISIQRNRKPFRTINNSQSPSKMSIGRRSVEFELVLDFVDKTQYDAFKNNTNESFKVTFTDADSDLGVVPTDASIAIEMGTVSYEEAEIDNEPDLPLLKVKGKALYDSSDSSSLVVTVTSTTDYEA